MTVAGEQESHTDQHPIWEVGIAQLVEGEELVLKFHCHPSR